MAKPEPKDIWEDFEASTWTARLPEIPLMEGGFPVMESYQEDEKGPDGKPTGIKVAKQRPVLRELTFRESGDTGSLIDIMYNKALGGDKNQAVASLVCSSLQNPLLTETRFNSLSLQVRIALFNEIMQNVGKDQKPGFPSAISDGQPIVSSSGTDAGGPGGPRAPSASELLNG